MAAERCHAFRGSCCHHSPPGRNPTADHTHLNLVERGYGRVQKVEGVAGHVIVDHTPHAHYMGVVHPEPCVGRPSEPMPLALLGKGKSL